jgi:MFS family permease
MAIVAPISGGISDRIGTRIPTVLGMLILSLGLILLSGLESDSPIYEIGIALGIVGLGTGMFISPNNSAIMGSAPGQRQGIAAGILATARSTGMVLGVGLAGAIFTTMMAEYSGENAIYAAIRTSFIIAAILAAFGAFTSAIKK